MKIFTKMGNSGSLIFYTEHFRVFLESHLEYFKNLSTTKTIVVDNHHVYRYEGDLYGYLYQELKIPKKYHWFILRLNDLFSSEDFKHDYRSGNITVTLKIPDLSEIDILFSIYKTQESNLS